jgi:hypothetical protein
MSYPADSHVPPVGVFHRLRNTALAASCITVVAFRVYKRRDSLTGSVTIILRLMVLVLKRKDSSQTCELFHIFYVYRSQFLKIRSRPTRCHAYPAFRSRKKYYTYMFFSLQIMKFRDTELGKYLYLLYSTLLLNCLIYTVL